MSRPGSRLRKGHAVAVHAAMLTPAHLLFLELRVERVVHHLDVFLDVGHARLGIVGVPHASWPRPVYVALTTGGKGRTIKRAVGGGAELRLGTVQRHAGTDGRSEVERVVVGEEAGAGVGRVLV